MAGSMASGGGNLPPVTESPQRPTSADLDQPTIEDDMTASADVTTAADEGLAVRGEPAGPQAAIVILCRDPGAREILRRELCKRYGGDYQIVVCGRPAELASWMRDLRAA